MASYLPYPVTLRDGQHTCGQGDHREKWWLQSLGSTSRRHSRLAAPPSLSLTAVANLPSEKAYLNKPLSFILYKPHCIIRLLKIRSLSRSEATELQASRVSRALSMELTSGARSHEPPLLQGDWRLTQLLGLSNRPTLAPSTHPAPTHLVSTLAHCHLPASSSSIPAY